MPSCNCRGIVVGRRAFGLHAVESAVSRVHEAEAFFVLADEKRCAVGHGDFRVVVRQQLLRVDGVEMAHLIETGEVAGLDVEFHVALWLRQGCRVGTHAEGHHRLHAVAQGLLESLESAFFEHDGLDGGLEVGMAGIGFGDNLVLQGEDFLVDLIEQLDIGVLGVELCLQGLHLAEVHLVLQGFVHQFVANDDTQQFIETLPLRGRKRFEFEQFVQFGVFFGMG